MPNYLSGGLTMWRCVLLVCVSFSILGCTASKSTQSLPVTETTLTPEEMEALLTDAEKATIEANAVKEFIQKQAAEDNSREDARLKTIALQRKEDMLRFEAIDQAIKIRPIKELESEQWKTATQEPYMFRRSDLTAYKIDRANATGGSELAKLLKLNIRETIEFKLRYGWHFANIRTLASDGIKKAARDGLRSLSDEQKNILSTMYPEWTGRLPR